MRIITICSNGEASIEQTYQYSGYRCPLKEIIRDLAIFVEGVKKQAGDQFSVELEDKSKYEIEIAKEGANPELKSLPTEPSVEQMHGQIDDLLDKINKLKFNQ